jgi:hypothetical protein
MRIDRQGLCDLPHVQLSKVGHAESFIAADATLPSLTRNAPRSAAGPRPKGGTWYLVPGTWYLAPPFSSSEVHAPPWLDSNLHSSLERSPRIAHDVQIVRGVIHTDVAR